MSAPFREDATWRAHRAIELEAERERLFAERAAHETRIVALQRSRLKAALGRVRSIAGVSVIVVSLAGGYVAGRFLLLGTVHACE